MPSCCVCKRSSPGLILHRFPPKGDQRDLWVQLLQANGEWNSGRSTRNSMICSDHFVDSSSNRTGDHIQLQEGANPTFSRRVKPKDLLCLEWPDTESEVEKCKTRVRKPALKLSGLRSHSQKPITVARPKAVVKDAAARYTVGSISQGYIGPRTKNVEERYNNNLEKYNENFFNILKKRRPNRPVDQGVPSFPKPLSLEKIFEDCDPLSLAWEHSHLGVSTLPDKFEAGAAENSDIIQEDVGNISASSELGTVSESKVKENDSGTEDELEFKEILSVKECMVVEDCQQIQGPSFVFEEMSNSENVKEEDDTNKTVETVTTDHSCEFCTESFNDESELIAHKVRCLVDWKPFGCVTCKKRFWDRDLYQEHKTAHWTTECPHCGFSQYKKGKKVRCLKCKRTWNRTKPHLISQKKKQMMKNVSLHSDHTYVKKESNSISKKTQVQEDIVVPLNSDHTNVTNLSEVKVEPLEPQGETVDLNYCEQPDLTICLKYTESRPEDVTFNQFEKPAYTKRLRTRRKKKSAQAPAKKRVEKPVSKCGTCDKLFASASDFQAHTQLVRCKKKTLQPVATLFRR